MTKKRKTKTVNQPNNEICKHEGPVFIPLLIKKSRLCIVERNEKDDISMVSVNIGNDVNTNADLESIISDIQRTGKENQEFIQKYEILCSQIRDLESDRDQLKSEVRLLKTENTYISKRVDYLEQTNADLRKQIEAAKSGEEKQKEKCRQRASESGAYGQRASESSTSGQNASESSASRQRASESGTSGQTAEKQAERKSGTSSEKSSRRRTAMEVSRRILEELNSIGNQGNIPYITLGSYMKELGGTAKPIKWRVLERKGKTMLLLSDKILDVKQYHRKNVATTWEECDLRTWLNVDFVKKAFHVEEEFLLKYTEIENQDNRSNSVRGGRNTKDRVFLLSQSEYYKYFPNKNFAKANATALAKRKQLSCRPGTEYGYWWLRSPGNGVVKAAQVNPDGNLITYGGNVTENNIGVRPAIWLELK